MIKTMLFGLSARAVWSMVAVQSMSTVCRAVYILRR